jgi:succinate-semialdehyde dehydrogenase / glutarate-semialdehyde dehydrogenase
VIPVTNPRSGAIDYHIAAASGDDVYAEAARLRAAQPAWLALGSDGRAAALIEWASALTAAAPALADRLSVDTGRRRIAMIEVMSIVGMLQRWAATGPAIIAGLASQDRPSANPTVTISSRHVPYPLFGAIAPWNFPLLLALIDAIPALMAGCAALIKPSEITPRFIPELRKTIAAVPSLAPVVALLEGDAGTGQALVECVDYVCFTGSVATGRKVAEAAARAFVPANLELGGKDPMIVLASADPVAAAQVALRSSVQATGQACQSIERIYVDRKIAQPFLAALVEAAKAVRLNYPDIDVGDIGPFIFPAQGAKVQAQIDDAKAKGATILSGGTVENLGGGQYLRPTVLTNVTSDMAVISEETFGPVLPVTIFDDINEAVALANASIYGLSAAVIGDESEAEAIATRLEAGAVSINDGALTAMVWDAENSSFKLSGMGPSRMGDSGIARFFRTQALIRQNGVPSTLAAVAEDGGSHDQS